jgi:hypothetical protein
MSMPSRTVSTVASSARSRAGHQAAVIPPVEADPRAVLPGLVLQVSRLIELFIVIDAERSRLRTEPRPPRRSAA